MFAGYDWRHSLENTTEFLPVQGLRVRTTKQKIDVYLLAPFQAYTGLQEMFPKFQFLNQTFLDWIRCRADRYCGGCRCRRHRSNVIVTNVGSLSHLQRSARHGQQGAHCFLDFIEISHSKQIGL